MLKNKGLILAVLVGAVMLFAPGVARAETGYCFCGQDKSLLNSETIKDAKSDCSPVAAETECAAMQTAESKLKCTFFGNTKYPQDQGKQACADVNTKYKADAGAQVTALTGFKGGSSKLIPECLLKNELSKECRDVSIFVYFLIQIARYLFTIIGALALIMFVYGGFTLILSQGNAEKVKKGTGIIVAAVIGLVIMFGAYTLVSFLGEAVDVKSDFQLTK